MINVNPIYKFLSWFCFLLVICIVGISNVFALENDGSLRFYDNNGSSLTYKTTDFYQQTGESSAIFTTTANSYGGALMLQTPTPLIANHIYSLFVNVAAANMGGFTVKSTKNCIGLGIGYNDTINSYINCSITPKFTQESGVTADQRNGLYFTFIANSNANYVLIAYTSTYTCNDCYQFSYGFNITDGGDTTGLTQTELNNKINQQTTTIQNEIYDMQQAISGSIDDMTDEIIANQNQNTEDIINSNKVCYDTSVNDIELDGKILRGDGTIGNNDSFGISKYFSVNKDTKITTLLNSTSSVGLCFYNSNKTLLSCTLETSISVGDILTIPTNTAYMRFTIHKNTNRPQFNICKNGNQATNDAINDLNDTLTDTTPVDVSSLGNTVGWLPSGPIDSIINLPLNFFNSMLSALSGTCQPLNIIIPFINSSISIPCLSTIFGHIEGLTTFWNWVGRIASIYILYRYLIALWEYYDRLTTMQVNFRDDFGGGV